MKLHREGRVTLFYFAGIFCTIVLALLFVIGLTIASMVIFGLIAVLYVLLLNFFRNPQRDIPRMSDQLIYAPADGKIVAIEETTEAEYFKDRRLQVSIFMSPLNVHVNRIPLSGKIIYQKYHRGKYLFGFHPKSSTENERNTIVIDQGSNQVLLRQIAGAVARRIKWYVNTGDAVTQGDELGFIKFGSRVDVLLPLDATIKVALGETVKGNVDVIAELSGL